MILHYLGLDHIGHISGPRSPLVPEKLKEMDNVIKKIHNQFQHSENAIVICGDHGIFLLTLNILFKVPQNSFNDFSDFTLILS